MIASTLLAFREGLEAALIVGVALGVLRRLRRPELTRPLWLGVAVAALLSLIMALALGAAGTGLEGEAEAAFEGITMLLAAGVLTWMVFWMRSQGRQIRASLEDGLQRAAIGGQVWAIFTLAFLAVTREGVEMALFLTASALTSTWLTALIGGLLGLTSAILVGWALFASTVRLDVRRFFSVTSALLLLFAAGLVAHGVHEMNELGWVPSLITHVWDTNGIVDEASGLGQVLKALFGYNGNPSLSEVLAYAGYLVGILFTLRLQRVVLAAPQHA